MKRTLTTLNLTIALALIIVLFVAGAPSVTAAPAPPPTLDGERLTGIPTISATCNPTGISTISFSLTGSASSPYSGTFVETGIVTMGPQNLNGTAPVLSFSAVVVINHEVVASMQLISDPFIATNLGFCTNDLRSFGVAATYSALIRAPGGLFSDSGKTGTALNVGTSYNPSQFNQFFQSSQFATTPR